MLLIVLLELMSRKKGSIVKVVVDVREKEFVKAFQGREGEGFEVAALEVGDFTIGGRLIIERKTFSDLAASIKDGRYREQKVRLKALSGKEGLKVMYLIENDGAVRNGVVGGLPVSTLMGAMTKCMLRDGFYVYQSAGVVESVKLIEKLKKQMEAGELGGGGGKKVAVRAGDYLVAVKTEKKANMTEEMCFLAQLKQIPGVSSAGAVAIKDKYGSMKGVFEAYRSIDSLKDGSSNLTDLDKWNAKRRMMADIKIGGRKLGKVGSEKIYKYLCGDSNSSS